MNIAVSLVPGCVVESTGDAVIVIAPHSSEAIRISGQGAHIVREANQSDSLTVDNSDTVNDLINRGILRRSRGLSRRSLIGLGSASVGAGVMTFALPSVASASSTISLLGDFGWALVQQESGPDVVGLFFQVPNPYTFAGDDVAEFDFPATSEQPGNLRVTGLDFDLVASNWESASVLGDIDFSDLVQWVREYPDIDTSNPVYPDLGLGDTATGEFEWAGQRYSVTFARILDS